MTVERNATQLPAGHIFGPKTIDWLTRFINVFGPMYRNALAAQAHERESREAAKWGRVVEFRN
jgi:hypothetical protein